MAEYDLLIKNGTIVVARGCLPGLASQRPGVLPTATTMVAICRLSWRHAKNSLRWQKL